MECLKLLSRAMPHYSRFYDPPEAIRESQLRATNGTNHTETDPISQTRTVLSPRRRLWLFSAPRTGSNMFVKMMSAHSNMAHVEYEFLYGAYWPTHDKHDLGKTSDIEQGGIHRLFEKSLEALVQKTADAENASQTVFCKEHSLVCMDRQLVYEQFFKDSKSPVNEEKTKDWTLNMPGESSPRQRTNPTMFPDEFLLNWLPVFLIRHPALMIPSLVRCFAEMTAEGENQLTSQKFCVSYTLRWQRMLYDWYISNRGPNGIHSGAQDQDSWPIILDVEDVVRGKDTINKFCQAANLDPEEVLYSWDSKSKEDINGSGLYGVFRGTLMESTGLRADLHDHNIDIGKEHKKWKEQYGEENAQLMREKVEAAMEDYEYLRSKRLGKE